MKISSPRVLLSGVLFAWALVAAPFAGAAVTLTQKWQVRYNGPITNAPDAGVVSAIAPDGNIVVAGNSGYATNYSDIYVVKYAAQTGAVVWERRSHGASNQNDRVFGMVLDSVGNVIVVGSRDANPPGSGTIEGLNFYVLKLSPAGAVLWERSFDGGTNNRDYFNAVGLDAQGNVLATGLSRRDAFSPFETDIYTYKFNGTTGATLWTNVFGVRPGFRTNEEGKDLAVGADGEVFVTGFANRSQSATLEVETLRIAGANGAAVWSQLYFEAGYSYGTGQVVRLDAAGNVFVASYTQQAGAGGGLRVLKYSRTDGALLWVNTYDGAGGADIARDLALDAAGNAVVVGYTRNAAGNEDFFTRKVNGSTGATVWSKLYDAGNVTPGLTKDDQAAAVAFDPAGNPVVAGFARYSTNGDPDYAILKYAAADGTLMVEQRVVSTVGSDDPSQKGLVVGPGHITVTGRSDTTFSNIDMYTVRYVDGTVPIVVTQAATGLAQTTATLNGTVNPNGIPTTAGFEYSTSPTLAAGVVSVTTTPAPGSGTAAVPVSAALTGLTPNTTYYFRLKAVNTGGTVPDGILSFATPPYPLPTVVTQAATPVVPTGAVLNGAVNPNGFATTASFDCNTSPTLAGTVVNVPVAGAPGSGTAAVPVSATLTGLTPGTTYYFRLNASNAGGPAQDGILPFTTPLPPPPTVGAGGVSALAQTTATLAGTVNPNGGPTTAEFLVGTSASLAGAGSFPATPAPGSGTAAVAVSAGVTGLAANTAYFYALRAVNAGGASLGSVQSFTTLPPPPTVTTVSASAIGFTSAVLNGLVKGNGSATTYAFDWGVSPALDQATPAQSLGNVSSTQLVSAALSGLALNTDYTFRARATNGGGTTLGSTVAFSTPPLTIGTDGRYTLVAGKTWTLGQEFIIPGDLIVEGTLVPNGWKLTVLGTVTVRPTGSITNPAGKVVAFFRDGPGASGVVTSLSVLETVQTFGLVGTQPMARLLDGGDGWMYGTTAAAGSVFRVSRAGQVETLAKFTGASGSTPQSALVGSAALGIYGTATDGGAAGMGTIFRVNPSGGVVKVADFNGANGGSPSGGLTVGPGGVLYGVAGYGGASNRGVLYRVSAGGAIEKLVDFTGPNGANPLGTLLLGSDGALYGTTTYGGAGGVGTVFRYDPTGGLVTLASLSEATGLYPVAGLVEGAAGVFYGTCYSGGANGMGTIFSVGGGAGATLLASFSAAVGSGPIGPMARGADGNFYGTTYTGSGDYGAIFKVTDAGTLTRVVSAGSHPGPGLLLGTDGAWYGVTQDGGAAHRGTVFRVLTTGALQTVVSFSDVHVPSTLTVGPVDGQLYGTTQRGGASGYGSVFALAPRLPAVTLASFLTGFGQSPSPGAGVLFGNDGVLYGTAASGGAGFGTVWKLPATGVLAALATFNGVNGNGPAGGLAPSGDGGFFGTTAALAGAGNVFKVTPAGVLTPQAAFTGANGAVPESTPVADGAGTFYGTTRAGGAAGVGAVWQFTPGGGVAAVASFTGANGYGPRAPLVRAPDGRFAGTTFAGGAHSLGTLFAFTPGGSLAPLFDFAGADGQSPQGALANTGDGGFFGTTAGGGGFGKGTVFRLGALGTLQTVAHLTGENDGSAPTTGLTAAPDGYLYGSTDSTVFRVPSGPSVTTLAATGFTPTQTTLRGEMQPRGLPTTATIEWGTTPALGNTLAAGNSSGTGAVAVSATLPGLAAGTTYYFRAKSANVMGVKAGSVVKFTTPALVANGGGSYTLPAGAVWTLPGDYTFAGNLTVLGTLDTAGKALTVQGKLTVNYPATILNATGVISYLDRDGALPPGALRLLGDAAHDLLDIDGDGLNTLLEFFLGTNPSVFSANALPQPAVVGGFLTLTYRSPAGVGGVQGIVEASQDMSVWNTGPGFTQVIGDTVASGVRTVTVRDIAPGAPQYLRLRVTR